MQKKTIVIALVSLYAISLAWAAGNISGNEFKLKPAKVKNPHEGYIKFARMPGHRLAKKPENLKGHPKGFGDNVAWFAVRLGAERTIIAMDRETKKLCIDLECNGAIADDEILEGELMENRHARLVKQLQDKDGNNAKKRKLPPAARDALLFGPIYLQLWEIQDPDAKKDDQKNKDVIHKSGMDKEDPNELSEEEWLKKYSEGLLFYIETRGDKLLTLYLASHPIGKVRVKGKPTLVALLDTNFDGMYNTKKIKGIARYDRVAVDMNGNGRFEVPREVFDLKQRIGVGGQAYMVAVAFDGSVLSMVEYTPKLHFGPKMTQAITSINMGTSLTRCRAGG